MPKKLFVKGQSGNPKGKPKGARHAATQISYALFEGNLEVVIASVLDRAKKGDMTACRMILDKVLPNLKERPVELKLPLINDLKDVAQAQAFVIQSVARGEVTPSEGEKISSIIDARRKSIESMDLELRVSQLEEAR